MFVILIEKLETYRYEDFFENTLIKEYFQNKNAVYMILNTINHKYYIGQSTRIKFRWLKHVANSNYKGSNEYTNDLQQDIRKYGRDNFEFIILEFCQPTELKEREYFYIKKYQSETLGYNQTELLGVDVQKNKLSLEQLHFLYHDLKESVILKKDLEIKYGVNRQTINAINRGHTLRQPNVEYPVRKLKEHEIKLLNDKENLDLIIIKENSVLTKNLKTKCFCGNFKEKRAKTCLECSNQLNNLSSKIEKEQLWDLLIYFGNFSYIGTLCGVSDNAIRKWCKSYGFSTKSRDYK